MITFLHNELKNICIPKKVNLSLTKMGFYFIDDIKVNNCACDQITGGTRQVTLTQFYSPMISTTIDFLNFYLYKDGRGPDRVSFGCL